jgi:hypothetical protein
MRTPLCISDNETCRAAVAGYVGRLRQAGIPVELSFIEAEARWDDAATAHLVWGEEEEMATDGEDEDGDRVEGPECSVSDVAPAVAEMYTRTIAYLGSDPRAAKDWLRQQELPPRTSAARDQQDGRKAEAVSRRDRAAPGTVASTAANGPGAGSL